MTMEELFKQILHAKIDDVARTIAIMSFFVMAGSAIGLGVIWLMIRKDIRKPGGTR